MYFAATILTPQTCGQSVVRGTRTKVMRFLAVALLAASASAVIKVGDTLPSVTLDLGFPPEKVNLLERAKGKNVIVMGLPGAFTPT